LHPGALDAHALALGLHYHEGEVWARAVAHLARAGMLASLRYAKRDAVSCYEQALAALAHLPESRETREQAALLHFNLAHALSLMGQFGRATESFLQAETMAVALEDHRRLAEIHGGVTYLLGHEGDFAGAKRSGLRALTIAASLGDRGLEIWVSVGLARVYAGQGDYRSALERLRWVTGALKDTPVEERFGRGSLMPSVACRAWLALCLGHMGEFPEAIAWGGDGVRIAEAVAGPLERVWAAYCLGAAHLERGDTNLAIPLLEQAAGLCAEGSFPIYAPRVLASLGAGRVMTGRPHDALPLLERAAADAMATKLFYGHPAILIHTGEAHLAMGAVEEARRCADEALDLATRQGARADRARALHLRGASRSEVRESREAIEDYRASLDIAEAIGLAPLEARSHLGLGAVHLRVGQADDAERELGQAADMLRAMGMRHWLEACEALAASIDGVADSAGSGGTESGGSGG